MSNPAIVAVKHVTGVWWVDKTRERNGDYVPVAHAMDSDPATLIIDSPRSKHLEYVKAEHQRRLEALK